MPNDGAVIIHRGVVVQPGGNAGGCGQGQGEKAIGFHAGDAGEGFEKQQGVVDEILKDIGGGGDQEGLVDLTVQCALHLAIELQAEIEDGGSAAGGADDKAILRGSRVRSAEQQKDDCDDEGCTFHVFNPEGFSYPWITRLSAQLLARSVSRGRASAPMVRVCLSD